MKKNIKYFFNFILGVVVILYILELLVTIFLPPKINVHTNLNQLRYNEAQKINAYYDTRNVKQAFLEEKEKLPELARGLGQGIKEFKKATREIKDEVQNATSDMDEDSK